MDEHIPIRGLEKLKPLERGTVADVIRSSEGPLAGLSPWQRRTMQWQISRDRAHLHVKLANLEHNTILAEASVACEARLAVSRERAYAAIFEATSALLIVAGKVRARRQSQAARLPLEGSREMVADAVDGLFATYLEGVQRRASRR